MGLLRPQDLYVALGLAAGVGGDNWTFEGLGRALGLSASQTFRSLERAERSHLFVKKERRVRIHDLVEFLERGVRYAFAATPGRWSRGVPTCWSAPGLEAIVFADREQRYVWSAPSGTVRGMSIEPLHASALSSVGEYEAFYMLLALTDVLRVGSARERKAASREIRERLL